VTSPRLLPISLTEFAARAAAHSGGVSGLVTSTGDVSSLARELADELEFVAELPTASISVADGVEDMLSRIGVVAEKTLILFGFASLRPEDWTRIDELRNLLQTASGLVLIMGLRDVELLQDHAPNLSSWLGGRVWRWSDAPTRLTEAEIQLRLATLRAEYGQTDEEVLSSARDGSLPRDPEYAEWLILLGHGRLLA